jgi:hypothetical protein
LYLALTLPVVQTKEERLIRYWLLISICSGISMIPADMIVVMLSSSMRGVGEEFGYLPGIVAERINDADVPCDNGQNCYEYIDPESNYPGGRRQPATGSDGKMPDDKV